MRQKRKQILTITALAALLSGLSSATLPAIAATLVQTIVADPLTGVALNGYDPVSYFTGTEPQLGVPDYTYTWQGVPWYFASPANRDVFMRHPEIYAPQFGGHCATSLARGFLSDGNPRLYAIDKVKLYLFYSVANREAFFQSDAESAARADANWTKLSAGLTPAQPPISADVDPAGATPAAD